MDRLTSGAGNRLLGLNAAAAVLGISPHTLRAWAQRGKVPVTRLGALLQFDRRELDALIQSATRQWKPQPKLAANARKGHQKGRLGRKAA
jgi:excisionase family DNA binding protein